MRKQLLALFSALGLAGSVTPGTAQALKGSDSAATTQQTQTKTDKSILIGLSKAPDANQKGKNSDKAVLVGLSQASDAKKKGRKAGGEQLQGDALVKKQFKGTAEAFAGGQGIRDKRRKLELENDAATKQQTVKLTNAQVGDGSVVKASKTAGDANSLKTETWVKDHKTAANTSAAQSEAAKKVDRASPK